jgi:hypothetical protein
MLEYWSLRSYITSKLQIEEYTNNNETMALIILLLVGLIALVIVMVAVYLAWECNCSSEQGPRLVKAFGAFIYPMSYLIYYLLVHKIFHERC